MPLWRYLADEGDATTLPVPMMNILNGGEHAPNNVDIQEFMVMPVGAESFSEGLRMGVEVFHHLKQVLSAQGKNTAVGDEGGFAPDLASNEEAIEVVLKAIESAGYQAGDDIVLALDAAATELFDEGEYVFRWSGGERRDAAGMVEFWTDLAERYPIASIEDGLDEITVTDTGGGAAPVVDMGAFEFVGAAVGSLLIEGGATHTGSTSVAVDRRCTSSRAHLSPSTRATPSRC